MNKQNETNNTYADIVNELQRSYDFFIDYYGLDKDKFVNVMICVMNSGRREALGWHRKDSWVDSEGKTHTELNICADYLDRDVEEILETLLHETAHLKNSIAGISDCTSTQYHNKKFKNSAESLGLVVEKMGNKGYALTKLGDEAKKAITALKPNREVYRFNRLSSKGSGKTASKYLAIFISNTYEEKIDAACEQSGKNRKSLVEGLIDDYLN